MLVVPVKPVEMGENPGHTERARKKGAMMGYGKIRLRGLLFILVVTVLMVFTGCEKKEGPTGPQADGTAAGLRYVGYSDTENRIPTCLGCHTEETFGWRQTRHANALNTLQENSYYQDYCRPCHTTGWGTDDGFYGADDAWAAASQDTLTYRDVQCEVCHGPASQHNNPYVEDPTDVLKAEDSELWDAQLCGICHEDEHHPYFEEWEESGHALADQEAGGFVATNENCARCHTAQSFERWLSTGETGFIADGPQPITCQACHTAHSNENPGQLRLPLGQNVICAKCHSTEGTLPGETMHHATWDVFTGTLAFTYPDSVYENSVHTTALSEQVCVACHVFRTPYQGPGNPAKTGHTFEPQLEACQQCHVGATGFDIYGVQTEIQGLIDQLQAEIDAAGTNDKATDSYKNAFYILKAAQTDGSLGVHNTKYTRKLLQDAISDFEPTGTLGAEQPGSGSGNGSE